MELITHHTLYQWESRNFPSCFLFQCGIHACRTRKNLWKPHTALLLLLSSVWSSSVTLITSLWFLNSPSAFRLKLGLFLETTATGLLEVASDESGWRWCHFWHETCLGSLIFYCNCNGSAARPRYRNASSLWKISLRVCLKELRRRRLDCNS